MNVGVEYSFYKIFRPDDKDFRTNDKDRIKIKNIIIPKYQRDYAQGRKQAKKIREDFLETLKKALLGEKSEPITLDFIYGDVENGNLIPLDGQQRLTTLFLLHWYAAKKEKVAQQEYEFLEHFSYDTRVSAREFCKKLVESLSNNINQSQDSKKSDNGKISEEIKDQYWFLDVWVKDPTISSMLEMIDDIAEKFADVENMWQKLKGRIKFMFLPVEKMGMTDELYIKMNSRGKPLTEFEQFKAKLEEKIMERNDINDENLLKKIDNEWTDMLWEYREEDNLIDEKFLNCINFIYDVIRYTANNKLPDNPTWDDYVDLFCNDISIKKMNENPPIKKMELFFDCWCKIRKKRISNFFKEIFSSEHEKYKIKYKDGPDLFKNCITKKNFDLKDKIIFYAITLYLNNLEEECKEKNEEIDNQLKIKHSELISRLRILRNLVQNSVIITENMKDILQQTESIICDGKIPDPDNSKNGFNAHQLKEESKKKEWIINNQNKAKEEKLYKLEDHELLDGQIGIIGQDDIDLAVDLADYFESLFNCAKEDRLKIAKALLSIGDYSQKVGHYWQLGNTHEEAWKTLFHYRSNKDYKQTSNVLIRLLEEIKKTASFNIKLLNDIVESYIKKCENDKLFDWRYYFLKYDDFWSNQYGKYMFIEDENQKYQVISLKKNRRSSKSCNLYLRIIFKMADKIKEESSGQYINGYKDLIINDKIYKITKNEFFVTNGNDENRQKIATVKQTEKGVDTEDRIALFAEKLKHL